jgi:ElaB/YqjD/DUF883 family membrane-anchored ribosome-binding protein
MNDMERAEIYVEVSELLDSIEEVFENNDVDVETDEAFAEIDDLLQRIRSVVTEE